MREIKFRAREGATGEILNQLYMGQCFQWVNHEMQRNVIIEQYTGLKDDNGSEIFEGDIIECKMELSPYADKWTELRVADMSCQSLDCEHGGGQDYFEIMISRIVIGNIHQNPELLK